MDGSGVERVTAFAPVLPAAVDGLVTREVLQCLSRRSSTCSNATMVSTMLATSRRDANDGSQHTAGEGVTL